MAEMSKDAYLGEKKIKSAYIRSAPNGWSDLAFAIIQQAIKDVAEAKKNKKKNKNPNTEPVEWLQSEECKQSFEFLDLPYSVIEDWVETGCAIKSTDELIIDVLKMHYKNSPARLLQWRIRGELEGASE